VHVNLINNQFIFPPRALKHLMESPFENERKPNGLILTRQSTKGTQSAEEDLRPRSNSFMVRAFYIEHSYAI
jgi:hypothetical protein